MTAFTGRFEPVPLPPGTRAIVAVAGRSGSDVWMLASGKVLRWDGARVTDRVAPTCLVDSCCGTLFDCSKNPAKCTKAAVERCQPFSGSCAMPVAWSALRITSDEVIVGALVESGGMRPSLVESRLGKNGRWSCQQGEGDHVYPGQRGRGDVARSLELSLGGASLRFEGPAVLVNNYGGYSLVVDGRRVPLPEVAQRVAPGPLDIGFAARSLDDLWLWKSEGGRGR